MADKNLEIKQCEPMVCFHRSINI